MVLFGVMGVKCLNTTYYIGFWIICHLLKFKKLFSD